MKKLYLTLTLIPFLLFLSIIGQTQVLQIVDYPIRERPEWLFNFCLEDLSGHDSTYLFRTIDSVRRYAIKEHDKKLVWYADLFQTVFLSYRRRPADEESLLVAKKTYFEASPYSEIKGACYFFVGTLYYFKRDFERSFHYYIIANDIFESLGYQKVPLIGHYCYNFFRLYYQVGDYPSAVRFLEAEIKSYTGGNTRHLPFAYNNLGVTYLKIGEVQKAQMMFHKSIEWARQLSNMTYVGIAGGNYGNTLRLQGRYKEALPYLYADVTLNKDTAASNSAISCVYIANSLLHLDSINKAARYLDSALLLKPDWVWTSFGSNYYEAKVIYYKKTGNYKLASCYQDSLLRLRDSLKLGNDLALFKAIALNFKEKKALAAQREEELEKSKLRVTGSFLLLLLLTVAAYLYQQRRKDKIFFQDQQRRDEEKLLQAEQQLKQYVEAIKEKNNMIEQIEAHLCSNPNCTVTTNTVSNEPAQTFISHPLLTESDWQEFKKLFTMVYPGFFTSLQNRYSGLSYGEIRLLALCKLNLSSKQMAAMLGISLQSLRTSRYRLRKKHPVLLEDAEFEGLI